MGSSAKVRGILLNTTILEAEHIRLCFVWFGWKIKSFGASFKELVRMRLGSAKGRVGLTSHDVNIS